MNRSSPDAIHAVVGIVIQLPPEAPVPLLIGSAALLVLVFAWQAAPPPPPYPQQPPQS